MPPLTNPDRWLALALRETKRRSLCIRAYCTTCGHRDFWQFLIKRALSNVDADTLAASGADLSCRSGTLNTHDSKMLVGAMFTRGLNALFAEEVDENTEAIRTIMIASEFAGIAVLYAVRSAPVVAVADAMIAHARAGAEREAKQREFELQAPARRLAKHAARQQRYSKRMERKAARDAHRQSVLVQLEGLSDETRLAHLANDTLEIPFAAIPAALVPRCNLRSLSDVEQERLKAKAGNLKAWRALLRSE